MADPTAPRRKRRAKRAPEEGEPRDDGPRFALSFIEGKALVGFEDREVSPWLTVRHFAMEIPDVTFPFDVTGGAEKFRHRRCRLVGIEFACDETELVAWLKERVDLAPFGIEDVKVTFADGFVEVGGTVAAGAVDLTGGETSTPGERVPFTLKIAIDASADREVRLLVHDVRLYAETALPAPLIAMALVRAVGASDLRCDAEPPATVRLDPVPGFLKSLLPRHGWKLPDARHLKLTAGKVEPGTLTLVFDAGQSSHPSTSAPALRPFLSALEGSKAFAKAEKAIAEGDTDTARKLYLDLEGPLPEHPFAAERTLALLAADPAGRDEALDLAEAWIDRDPGFAPALWVQAQIRAEREHPAAARGFLTLSVHAQGHGEKLGALAAAVAAGTVAEADGDLGLAVSAWERALTVMHDDPAALEALARLLPKVADPAGAARALGRLLAVSRGPERARAHLALGRLHAGDAAALGMPDGEVARAWKARRPTLPFEPDLTRAKLHFDAALRLEPKLTDAWLGLGRACVLRAEPLRAVRCLDKGREGLIEEGRPAEAAEVAMEIGRLWETELGHEENALLRYRQVLEIEPGHLEASLRYAAMSERLGYLPEADDAYRHALDALAPRLGPWDGEAEVDVEAARAALDANEALARIAKARHGEAGTAAARGHLEAAVALCAPAGADDRLPALLDALVDLYEQGGDPEALAAAHARAAEVSPDPRIAARHLARAARILSADLDDPDAARVHLEAALEKDPEGIGPLEAALAIATAHGPPEAAAAALEVLARVRDDADGRARALLDLGTVRAEAFADPRAALDAYREAGQTADAQAIVEEAARAAARVARRLPDTRTLADALDAVARSVLDPDPDEIVALRLEEASLREVELEDPEGAVHALASALDLSPGNPRLLWHLGRLALDAGDAERAHRRFLDLVEAGGPAAAGVAAEEGARRMGEAAIGAGDREAAAQWLLDAFRLGPEDGELGERLDALLEELGRHEERYLVFHLAADAARSEGATDRAAHHLLDAARLAEGALDRPKAALGDVFSALETVLPEPTCLALIEGRAEEVPPPVASRAAERLLALAGTEGDVHAEAAAHLALAALAPSRASAVAHLEARADALALTGETASEARALERALTVDPERDDLRERLATLLAGIAPKAALSHYEVLVTPDRLGADPDGAPARLLRAAELATAANRPDRARHHLGLYVARAPGDDVALEHYAALLRADGAWSTLHDTLVHHGELLAARGARTADEAEVDLGAAHLVEAARIARDRLDDPVAARAAFELALQYVPDLTSALEAILPYLGSAEDLPLRADVLGRLAEQAGPPAVAAAHYVARAEALEALENLHGASQAFADALDADPLSIAAADGLARVAWARGDLAAFADAAARRAAQATDRGEADAARRHLVVARILLDALGDTARGVLALDAALETPGELDGAEKDEAYRRRLACHLAAGNAAGAESDLSALIALVGRRGDRRTLAALYRHRASLREDTLGDAEGAREDWAETHRLDPDDEQALGRLMRIAEAAADQRALATLQAADADRRVRAGDPSGAARVLWHRARGLVEHLGDREGARASLESAAEHAGGALAAEILADLRALLEEDGELDLAAEVARREAAPLPDREAAAHLLSVSDDFEAEGRTDLALALARDAFARDAASPVVAARLTRRLFLAGAVDEALGPARLLAEVRPDALARAEDRSLADAVEELLPAAEILADADAALARPLAEALLAAAPERRAVADLAARTARAVGDLAAARSLLESHHDRVRHPARQAEVALELADLAAAAGDHGAEASWLEASGDTRPQTEARLLAAYASARDAEKLVDVARRLTAARIEAGEVDAAARDLETVGSRLLDALDAPVEAASLLAAFPELCEARTALLELAYRAARGARRDDEAAGLLERLARAELDDGDEEAAAAHLVALGTLQLDQRGDPEAALHAFLEALSHGLRDSGVAERALELAIQRGDAATEADLHETLVDLGSSPDVAAAHLAALGALYAGPLDAPDRAEAAFREALDRVPGNAAATDGLRALLSASGRRDELAAIVRSAAERQAGEDRASLMLEAAEHAVAAGAPAEAVEDLLAAREADAEAFRAADGDARLDAARAAAGLHRDRAEARLDAALGSDSPEILYLEAGDILAGEVGDATLAERAYRAAFQAGRGQRAAERLRSLLDARGDHRGLAELAETQAEDVPPGPARAGLLRSAGDLYRDEVGDLDAAIAAYAAAFDADPSNGIVADRLTAALSEAGREAELAELTRRLAEDAAGADRARQLVEAAELHERSGDRAAALSCLLDAEAADPDDPWLSLRVADALWDADRHDEAATRYRTVLTRDPEAGRAYERLAEVLEAAGDDLALAEVTEQRAAAAEGRLAVDLWLRAARLFERLDEGSRARRAAEQAFAADPGDSEAFAAALARAEAEEDAAGAAEHLARHLDALPDTDPAVPNLLRRLADARRQAGDATGARTALDALLERVPEDTAILALAADLAAATGENAALPYDQRLVEAADAGAEVDPGALLAARRRLGTAASGRGDVAEAVSQLRAALAGAKDDMRREIAGALALAARRAERPEVEAEAEEALAALAEDGPERVEHLLAAARARTEAGSPDEAHALFAAAFDLDPGAPVAAEALAAAAEESGDVAARCDILARHAEALTDGARRRRVLLELARVAGEAGEQALAERSALEAFELDRDDPEAARIALPALRARGPGSGSLVDALTRLAADEAPEARARLLLEAVEAAAAGEEKERAVALAERALDTARDVDPWDDALRGQVLVATDLVLPLAKDPAERAEIHGLAARAADGEACLAHHLAEALAWEEAGKGDRAALAYEVVLALAPKDPRPARALVTLSLAAGDLEAAASAARALAERLPTELPDEIAQVALACESAERPDLSRPLLGIVAERAPGPDALDRFAAACVADGDIGEAARAASAALDAGTRAGDDPEAQKVRAQLAASLLEREGNAPGAADAWARVLEIDPADEEAAAALDAHHRARKDWEALTTLHRRRAEAFVSSGNDDAAADADVAAAAAAREGGDADAARTFVDAALARRPAHAAALEMLRTLARDAGDTEAAARALGIALGKAETAEERASVACALGRLHAGAGDPMTAAAAYRVALVACGEAEAEGAPEWARDALRESAAFLAGVTLSSGDPAGALVLVDRARAVGATGVDLARVEGRAALFEGDPARARDRFQSVLDVDPDDRAALEGIARASEALGDTGADLEARAHRAAAAEDPRERAELWLAVADHARKIGRVDEATHAEDEAFEANPGSDRVFEAVRRRLERTGDAAALATAWRKRARSVEDDVRRAEAFFELGEVVRLREGDAQRAVDAYERCLALSPDHLGALAALAETLHVLGRPEREAPLLRRLPSGAPGLPAFVVHHRLGEIDAAAGRVDAALAEFREAVAHNSGFLPAWIAAEELSHSAPDAEGEAWALEGHLAALPDEAVEDRVQVLKRLALLERQQLKSDAALRHYQAALRLVPVDVEVLEALGDLYTGQGRWREAEQALTALADACEEPDAEAEVMVRLARLHTDRLADADGALPHLIRGVEADPDHAEAWRLRLELEAPRGDAVAIALCARRLMDLGHERDIEPWSLEVGRALMATGDAVLAAPRLLEAAEARSADRALVAEAAAALWMTGRAADAASLLRRLAERTGQPADLREAAEAALAAGDARGYVEDMWQGLRDTGMDPHIQGVAARGLADVMAKRLGDPASAAEALVPFLASRPDDRGLKRDRALHLEAAGRADEALDLWLDLGRTGPDDVTALKHAADVIEPRSAIRAWMIRGIASFVEGLGPRPDAADLAGLRVSEISRMEVADPAIVSPLGWFFRAMAPVLEPLFPADVSRYGVGERLDPAVDANAARVVAWARVLTDREVQVYRSDRLGFEFQVENTQPASLILGGAVLDASPGERDQVVARAVELLGAGAALPAKFAGGDMAVLVRLALAYFDETVEVPLPDERRKEYLEAMVRLCPEPRRAQLGPLAAEAVAALPRFDPAGFAPALRRTADRVALLCTGDVPGALSTLLRLDRRATIPPVEDRAEIVRAHPAAFDLCRFVLRDDLESLWEAVRD